MLVLGCFPCRPVSMMHIFGSPLSSIGQPDAEDYTDYVEFDIR